MPAEGYQYEYALGRFARSSFNGHIAFAGVNYHFNFDSVPVVFKF